MPDPPAGLHVRPAGHVDAGAIAHLRALWTEETPDPGFEAWMAEWLCSEGERRTTWLAVLPSGAVGMASLFDDRRMPRPQRRASRWADVSNMFVVARWRGAGIGSALLGTLMATAHARGYARLVLSPAESAVPFYRRAGFVLAGDGAGEDRLLVAPGPQPRSSGAVNRPG